MNQFKDKVIWITGASSGIGEALALEFAKREARLILSARRVKVVQQGVCGEQCRGIAKKGADELSSDRSLDHYSRNIPGRVFPTNR